MRNIFKALRLSVKAAIEEFRFVRHMQKGGNPDYLPF